MKERENAFADLVAEVEKGRTLDKKEVVARMGKPDAIQETWSKQYADSIISTTYQYALPPGTYSMPGEGHVRLAPGSTADFYFDERAKHGPRGRLASLVDDSTPLLHLTVSGVELMFPASRRSIYAEPAVESRTPTTL